MRRKLDIERYKLLLTVQRLMEGPLILLGFLWLVLLMIELTWKLTPTLEYLDLIIWIIFIIDFFIKFAVAPSKFLFLKRNWITTISLIIPALRLFGFFRFLLLTEGLRGIQLLKIISSLNKSMRSLTATMERRAFGYISLLTLIVTFAGAAGMLVVEKPHPGFDNYGMALWWTAMRIVTAGSEFWPTTPQGRILAFFLSLFGYCIYGYITATLASFFIDLDAGQKNPVSTERKDIAELKAEIGSLTKAIEDLKNKLK